MLDKRQDGVVLAHEAPFRVGAISFHPSHRLVSHNGTSVVVEPRVMQLLVALARADEAILSRDDIMQRCWNGRIVGENALHRAVARARKVLEQAGDGTLEIETIKGVGYRLRSTGAADLPEPHRFPIQNAAGGIVSRRGVLAAVGACSAAAAGAYLLFGWRASSPSQFALSLYTQAEAARKSDHMGSREQAIALYREAIRDSPAFPAAWAGLSLTYCQLMEGSLDSELVPLADLALSAANRCLHLDPDNVEGNLAKFVIPSHFRRWNERKKQLQLLAGRRTDSWLVHAYLGRIAADTGDAGSAVESFRRAYEAQPASAAMAGQLAYAMWSAGMLHELEQLLDVSSTRWQRSWYLWNVRFNYLAYSGQFEAAAEQVQARRTLPFNLHPNAVEKRLTLLRALRDRRVSDVEASRDVYLAEAVERPQHVRNAGMALAALGASDTLMEVLRGYLLGRGRYATEINTYSRRPTYIFFLPPFERLWSGASFVNLMSEVGLSAR